MNKDEIKMAFDNVTPDDTQKARMLGKILSTEQPAIQPYKPVKSRRKVWFSASAVTACLALVLVLTLMFNIGGGTVAYALSIKMSNGNSVLMEDRSVNNRPTELASSVSYVDSRPQLRFFITGEEIAKIEISSNTEYITASDWTETLDERYWNPELYYEETEIDGTVYQYIPGKSGFDKSLVLVFPEGFKDYDQVWYDWYAWDLYDWASEDDFSHFQGHNSLSVKDAEKLLETASEEEKLAIAAGGGGTSAAGHILLDGYPVELLNDSITITITDRQGNTVTKTLTINISNNVLGQTVVTANMID